MAIAVTKCTLSSDLKISRKQLSSTAFQPFFLFCVLLLALVPAAWGQTGQAVISGVVTDPAGASLPNAQIAVKNTATGVVIKATTNDTGYYEVRDLNPGTYEVSVEADGFDRFVATGVVLLADGHPSVDAPLKVGTSSQSVVVTDAAPLVETQAVSLGQVITSQEMANLPNGQAPIWLAMLAPGVQSNYAQNYQLGGADPSWNGAGWNFGAFGRLGANEYSIDGAPNMANERTQALNLSPEETGQTSVNVTQFDAQVGHTYGIYMTQTTKAGTNDFHGGVRYRRYDLRFFGMQHFQRLDYYYQMQQDNCNADPGTAQCQQDQSLYGWPGTHLNYGDAGFGGPVRIPHLFDFRNKLFFFVGVTIEAPNNASSTTLEVPTALEKTGNFSDLDPTALAPTAGSAQANLLAQAGCPVGTPFYGQFQVYNPYSVTFDSQGIPRRLPFCNNVIPSNLIQSNLPLVQFVNSSLPNPNLGGAAAAGVNNYFYVPANYNTYRAVTNRYDYAASNSDHLFFRWTRSHYWQHAQQFLAGGLGDQYDQRWIKTGTFGWSHVLSNRTFFETNVGATQWSGAGYYYPNLQKYTASSLGLPSYLDANAAPFTQFPILNISGYQQIGDSYAANKDYRTLAVRGNLTSVHGNHTIRGGAEWRLQNVAGGGPTINFPDVGPAGLFTFDDTYVQQNDGADGTYPTTNTGLGYASFLMGVQDKTQVETVPSTSRSNPYYAVYAGDTWRVSRKVTIVPGLRYEYEYGPTEKHNRQIVGWDPNAPLMFAGVVDTAYQATLAAATPAQKAILPAHLPVQGGPIYAGVNGASRHQWVNDWRFLPRLGVAYAINSKTVLRGGAGYFFDTLDVLNEDMTDEYASQTTEQASTVYGADFNPSAPPVTNPFPETNGGRFAPNIGSSAIGADYYDGSQATLGIYDHNRVPARSQRFQVSLDRQIGNSTVVEVAYVGSRTTNITLDGNQNNTRSNSAGYLNATSVPEQFFAGGTQPNTASNALLGALVPNPFYIGNLSSFATSNPLYYNLLSKSTYITSPTIQVADLVRAYPQLQSLQIYKSIGTSQFQEIQGNLSKRLGSGLVANVSYQWNYQKDRDYFMNPFDTHPSVESTILSPPWRVTSTWVYTLPFGPAQQYLRSGLLSTLVGGFRLSGSFEDNPGALLSFSGNGSPSGGESIFFIGDPNSIRFGTRHWIQNTSGSIPTVYGFNTAQVSATATSANNVTTCSYTGTGFVTESSTPLNPGQCLPTSYNLRVFPTHVEGVRAQGVANWNMNVGRTLNPSERVKTEARADVMNVFNHQRLAAVGGAQMNPSNAQFGQITADGGNGREFIFEVLTTF